MNSDLTSAFAVRLRDLLATLESSALIGAAHSRMRGLGEQLQFACLALPCAEALVALELGRLGRLQVPGVAGADQWRTVQHEFLPSGTPFAYLLGGGGGYGAELTADDPMLDALRPVLEIEPRHGIFVPLRVGSSVVGGAALLDDQPLGDEQLIMAERLAEVLALTLESFRTERVLLQLFAQVLPELCDPERATNFMTSLEPYIHTLRLSPEYRRRLLLAESVGNIAAHGNAETELAADILARIQTYITQLNQGAETDGLPPIDVGDDLLGA